MDANSPTDASLPSPPPAGQCAFFDVDDSAWVALVLRRLAAGDVVTIDRWGNWLFTDA